MHDKNIIYCHGLESHCDVIYSLPFLPPCYFAGRVLNVMDFPSDIDECSPVGDCMHICENTDGGYNCKCNADFKVDPDDSKKCIREFHFMTFFRFPIDARFNCTHLFTC